MPFPLAHPAAVIPLRRFCPRFLSFPALVAGSVSPDVGYFFSGIGADRLSHSLLGSIIFSLPVGLLGLGIFYGLSFIAERYRPVIYQRVFIPFSAQTKSSAPVIVLSVLIGTWTHLLLDSITHKNGWLVLQLPFLRSTIATVSYTHLRVCHLLWYGCSFFGMAWLFLAFRTWQQSPVVTGIGKSWRTYTLEAALVASLLLPIELAHHLIHGTFGLVLVAALCLAWLIGIVFRISRTPPVML